MGMIASWKERRSLRPTAEDIATLHAPHEKHVDPFVELPLGLDNRKALDLDADADEIEELWATATTFDGLKEDLDHLDALVRLAATDWPAGAVLSPPSVEPDDEEVAESEALDRLRGSGWPEGVTLVSEDAPDRGPAHLRPDEDADEADALRRLAKSRWQR